MTLLHSSGRGLAGQARRKLCKVAVMKLHYIVVSERWHCARLYLQLRWSSSERHGTRNVSALLNINAENHVTQKGV